MPRLQVFVADDAAELARGAASDAAEILRAHPQATVICAVGDSPAALYQELAARRRLGELDTSGMRVVQLDEYAGIPPDHERSFYAWLERDVIGPLGVPAERVIPLRGDGDGAVAAERYETAIARAGGIDLAILGLGTNGHVGFNEPPSAADSPTRVVELSAQSRAAGARHWGRGQGAEVPRHGITAGMRVLLAARETILVVSGMHKAQILRATLSGPVTPDVPASLLRTIEGVRVYADRDAWEGLPTLA